MNVQRNLLCKISVTVESVANRQHCICSVFSKLGNQISHLRSTSASENIIHDLLSTARISFDYSVHPITPTLNDLCL